jgi:hypothetical protein
MRSTTVSRLHGFSRYVSTFAVEWTRSVTQIPLPLLNQSVDGTVHVWYASVGLFSIGSLLGGCTNLVLPHLLWLVGSITLVGIAALVFAAVQLIHESFICMNVITDSQSKLEGTRPDAS